MAFLFLHPRLWLFRLTRFLGGLATAFRERLLPTSFLERFRAARPWQTPLEAYRLYCLALQRAKQGTIVEIGSAWGGMSCLFSHAAKQVGGKVYCVDPWPTLSPELGGGWNYLWGHLDHYNVKLGDLFTQFQQNVAAHGAPECIEAIRANSVDAAKTWNRPIHLLFIDGSHDYEDVVADIRCWEPFLVQGGVIAFHDYRGDLTGVERAVHEHIASSARFSPLQKENALVWATKRR